MINLIFFKFWSSSGDYNYRKLDKISFETIMVFIRVKIFNIDFENAVTAMILEKLNSRISH